MNESQLVNGRKVIHTMTWSIASWPKSLLFDFSDLEIENKQDILKMIHSNLSPSISTKVIFKEEFLIELVVQSSYAFLARQMRSVLKHQGLQIYPNLYLKPTSALTYNQDIQYWIMHIHKLPLD